MTPEREASIEEKLDRLLLGDVPWITEDRAARHDLEKRVGKIESNCAVHGEKDLRIERDIGSLHQKFRHREDYIRAQQSKEPAKDVRETGRWVELVESVGAILESVAKVPKWVHVSIIALAYIAGCIGLTVRLPHRDAANVVQSGVTK